MNPSAANWYAFPLPPDQREFAPPRIDPEVLRDMAARLGDEPPEGTSTVTNSVLAELVRWALPAETEPGAAGATIVDPDRQVTYTAHLGRDADEVWVSRIAFSHADGGPVTREDLGRIPLMTIGEAAMVVAETAAADPEVIVHAGVDVPSEGGNRPTMTELARLMREEGHTRRTLARLFGRPVSTVDDWIGEARREIPDQMPPPGRGGRPRKMTPRRRTPAAGQAGQQQDQQQDNQK